MDRGELIARHGDVTRRLRDDLLELAAVRSAITQQRAKLFLSLNTGAYSVTAIREMVSADVAVNEAAVIELQAEVDAGRAELNHLEWCLREVG